MKKVIIGMLLLLPLIIVASVLFAIDIISVEAYIAVDRVELNHTSLTLNLSDLYYDGLTATVYPTSAKNKEVHFEIIDVEKFAEYDGEIAEIDAATGHLKLNSYGTFTIKVTTMEGNKTAFCHVYISGDKVKSVTLEANRIMQTGQSQKIVTVFQPVDAIVKSIEWSTSDQSVVRVDKNGIITAVSQGHATISVVSDEATNSIAIEVVNGLTKYGETLYISSNSFNFDEIGLNPSIISTISGGTHNQTGITFNGGSNQITINTTLDRIITIYKCDADDIVIEHADILTASELRVGKLPIELKARYKDSRYSNVDASFTSSDNHVAEISASGAVTAKNKGSVTFIATYGGKSATIEINVVKPISLLVIDKNPSQEKRGILEATVYGNKYYKNGSLENAIITVGIVFPTDVDIYNELTFAVNDTSLARFLSGGRLELFGDFSGGKQLTITVSAKITPYESVTVSKSHTIMVYNGVNCYNIDDMDRAVKDKLDVYLMSDIDFGENGKTLNLDGNAIHGNGHIMDGSSFQSKTKDYTMIHIVGSNSKVSNITIRNDEAQKIAEPNGLMGSAIVVGKPENQMITDVVIEYSILENVYYAIISYNAAYTLRGSIIRNTSNFGINIPAKNVQGVNYTSEVILENVMMSNIVAPAIGVNAESNNATDPKLTINGFLDMYNWQQIDSMKLLDRDFLEGSENAALNKMLKDLVKNLLRDEFKKSRYDDIRVDYEGSSYLHLGIITAGAIYDCKTVPEWQDERIKKFDIKVLYDGSLIPGLTLKPCILYNYDNESNIMPWDVPLENAELYARLRG